jgi:hypothetical protein
MKLGKLQMDALGHWAEAHSPVALQRCLAVGPSVESVDGGVLPGRDRDVARDTN